MARRLASKLRFGEDTLGGMIKYYRQYGQIIIISYDTHVVFYQMTTIIDNMVKSLSYDINKKRPA